MRWAVPVVFVALCHAPGLGAQELRGSAEVVAGDRLRVAGRELRLFGIDAPEAGQRCLLADGHPYDCGRIAATALMDLTAGVELRCRVVAPGAPPLARCRTPDGYDLSRGMVYAGWAVAWPRANNPLLREERIARARRHGLWRGRFLEPWRWRKRRADGGAVERGAPLTDD